MSNPLNHILYTGSVKKCNKQMLRSICPTLRIFMVAAPQGPVVQSIVSLTSSLRGQLSKCFASFITKYTDIFCGKNEKSFCTAKAFHIFSTKNTGIFEILTFEILTKR